MIQVRFPHEGAGLSGGGSRHYDDPAARAEPSTVSCSCGQTRLLVNWIRGPWCGGYLKVTCPACGASEVVFDDFA